MKNTLTDLNNHLFAQIERLGQEDLTRDELTVEVIRTASITSVSKEVISNARLIMDARTRAPDLPANEKMPKLLN